MQAITVRFYPPTNTRPARAMASAAAGNGPMVSTHQFTNNDEAARALAHDYAQARGWDGNWFSGDLADGSVVFVCLQGDRGMSFAIGNNPRQVTVA